MVGSSACQQETLHQEPLRQHISAADTPTVSDALQEVNP